MRSPGSARLLAERVLRGFSVLALLVMVARLWSGAGGTGVVGRTHTSGLDSALVTWSALPPAGAIVDADTLPAPVQRDWLVALRRTGTEVRWTSADSSGGALVIEAGPQPGAPARVVALVEPARSVLLADALGQIDSATATDDGVVSWRANPIGLASANVHNAIATAAPRDSFSLRPVLVVGQAGWESRFVVTALEESGWTVAARLSVAPGAVVRQGGTVRIDTASLSAVVILDSTTALDGNEIAQFVRQGGGLVAAGAGSRNAAVRRLLPAVHDGGPGEIGALLGPEPRTGLSTRTFVASTGAVPLERRGDAPVVLARRAGSGRVVAIGYDDTWRLRMVPAIESAPEAHRNWWSSLVGGVALVRPLGRDVGSLNEAPLASTVSALGPPMGTGASEPAQVRWPWELILAAVAGIGMLAEWLSRRLRGLA